MSDTLIEALSCASRGWQTIPIHTIRNGHCTCGKHDCKPGKHPIGRLTPNGLKDATRDPARLSLWWSQRPDANLAVVTGAESGLVVLDVDPDHGGEETLADLEVLHGKLPPTVEAITGSGGRHIYFRHPGRLVPNSASKVGPGLDIRGDGGYVVAPPSLHISGQHYAWEVSGDPNEVEPAEMPAWLLELATDPPSRNGHAPGLVTPSGLPLSKAALAFVANGAPVGQQRARAVAATRSYLAAGYSVAETADAIWRGLQASPVGDLRSPWSHQDALDMAEDLASKPAPPPAPLSKPQAPQSTEQTSDSLPTIYASCQDLQEVTDQCWAALQKANTPPRYFRYGGIPSRLERDDQGAPVVRDMTAERLRHELARIAHWKARKQLKNGAWQESEAKPPVDVMKDVLATANPPLPILTRIVEVPVFASDGTLQTTPGYHPAARTFYAPAPGLQVPTVPDRPTAADIGRAARLIGDVLADFPFVADADRAHAVALLVLPFVRDMIDGPTPNHLIEAPTAGSGKGLLADVLTIPSVGNHVGVVTTPRDEEEFRKRLTAQFREGKPVILLDNVNQLDSGTLAAALTAPTWDDRVLGKTEMVSISIRCSWITTANNPTMTTEIARRCVRIRLDPKVDRPWQRDGFRIPNLRGWATEHRGELVWAALTLVQAWVAAGRPLATSKPLGSYERWTQVIGGILQNAGIPGFLTNLEEFYEAADQEGVIWRQFVAAWFEKHGSDEVGTAELFPVAQELEVFDLGKGGERSQRTAFGKLLARQRDRVIGEYRITQGKVSHKLKTWRLLPTKDLFSKGSSGGTSGTLGYIPIPPCESESRKEIYIEGETYPDVPNVPPIPPLFPVTEDWQEVPEGVMLPNGVEVRMDAASGKNFARLHPAQHQHRYLDTEPDPYLDSDWDGADADV